MGGEPGWASRALSVVALFLVSCASPQPPMKLDVGSILTASTRLVAAFAGCVGPLGPTRQLPRVVGLTTGNLDFPIPLSGRNVVSDGFDHWLVRQRSGGTVYVVQVGGIAGTQEIFGPFSAEEGCSAFPPIE